MGPLTGKGAPHAEGVTIFEESNIEVHSPLQSHILSLFIAETRTGKLLASRAAWHCPAGPSALRGVVPKDLSQCPFTGVFHLRLRS